MRVHLSAIVEGVLGPNCRVDTPSDLDILGSIVLKVVGREDVAIRHFEATILLLAVTVDCTATLVGGDGGDSVTGHECTELVGRVDGSDDGLGLVLCCTGDGFVGKDWGCNSSDEEGLLQEHCCVCKRGVERKCGVVVGERRWAEEKKRDGQEVGGVDQQKVLEMKEK